MGNCVRVCKWGGGGSGGVSRVGRCKQSNEWVQGGKRLGRNGGKATRNETNTRGMLSEEREISRGTLSKWDAGEGSDAVMQ